MVCRTFRDMQSDPRERLFGHGAHLELNVFFRQHFSSEENISASLAVETVLESTARHVPDGERVVHRLHEQVVLVWLPSHFFDLCRVFAEDVNAKNSSKIRNKTPLRDKCIN